MLILRGGILAVLALLLTVPALAAFTPAAVRATLATMTTADPAQQRTAEDALVAAGRTALPTLQALLPEYEAALAKADATVGDDTTTVYVAQRRVNALTEAIARLAWEMSPRETLVQWLRQLTRPNGTPFDREADPRTISGPRLRELFPTQQFYYTYFPPYRGGAAPPDFLIEQLEVPAAIARLTIFAVSHDGTVRYFTDIPSLTAFAQANLPSGKTVDVTYAAAAYLLLATTLYQWNDEPLAFTLNEKTITARAEPGCLVVTAVAEAVPTHNNHGRLTARLTFDANRKLTAAEVEPALELSIWPLYAIP